MQGHIVTAHKINHGYPVFWKYHWEPLTQQTQRHTPQDWSTRLY